VAIGFNGELPANWLIFHPQDRLIPGDAVATAAELGSIVADSQGVIELNSA